MRRLSFALLMSVLPGPALAEVKSSGESGFVTEARAAVAASPTQIWAALATPSRWWDGAHSYSGDAANFSLDLRAGGCFCERAPKTGGSIEHARVILALPGETLRLSGALGPLQGMGLSGTLTWELKAGGKGTEIVNGYAVGGYFAGGAKAIAGPVDAVLAHQLARLVRYVETGKPD